MNTNRYGRHRVNKHWWLCVCVFITLIPIPLTRSQNFNSSIHLPGQPASGVYGRLWDSTARNWIAEGYVFALSNDGQRIYGYSKTIPGVGPDSGRWQITNLPPSGEIILIGFHPRFPFNMAAVKLTLEGRMIELKSFETESNTNGEIPDDMATAGTPVWAQLLALSGWIASEWNASTMNESAENLANRLMSSIQKNHLRFDGSSNAIEIKDASHLSAIGSQATFEFWVKFTDVNASPGNPIMLLRKWGPAGPSDDEYHLAIHDDGTFRISLSGRSGQDWICSKTRAITNQWIHVAGVLGNGSLAIFINGKQDNQKPSGVIMDRDTSESLWIGIGGKDIGLGLNGQIHSIRISDCVRYSSDFRPPDTYQNDSNTRGLWLVNEGSGIEIRDLSDFRHDGRCWQNRWE